MPTAQVDKHWTDDRIDLWGMFMQQPGTATLNRLGACSLVAQEKELLVHKIEAWFTTTSASGLVGLHLFTPLQAYAPTAINPALVLPWLQPVKPGQPGRLSRAIGVAGETDAGLMTVTVNGAPHTAIGPVQTNIAQTFSPPVEVWGFQDPPLRVKPLQQLTIQSLNQIPTNTLLNVNWFWTERVFQGDVG